MDENPLRTTAIKPESLVMRSASCFYCGRDFQSDYCINNSFGIRYCRDHASWAERDCKAYVHEIHQIPAYFAIRDSDIRDFVNMINICGISILRSSGEFESDWFFNSGSIFDTFCIIKQKDSWSIPLINKKKTATKNVLMSDFVKAEFRQHNQHLSDMFYRTLVVILNKLEDGLYKKEYEQHLLASKSADTTSAPEDPNIYTTLSETGQMIRILLHD